MKMKSTLESVAEEMGLDLAKDTALPSAQVESALMSADASDQPADVMKVGGRILAHEDIDGSILLDEEAFETIGDEIAHDSGNIALVTSAAIIRGMQVVGLKGRPDKSTEMPELQRLSSIGRRHIENTWADFLPDCEIGGLSLTSRELDDLVTREETLRVIHALFAHDEVPVINENDAVTHDEISFGSNDILAAKLASRMQGSDLFGTVRLFLLTNVNGVYEDVYNPNSRISVIEDTDEYRHLAGGADASFSIGGMESKFEAADIARAAGVDTWVYNPAYGHREQAVSGEIGTYFPAAI